MRRASWALLAWVPAALAHDPISTKLLWTQEISRIVYKHCGSCHREGGGAMPLMTYEEARPWAKATRDEVLTRRMPPWGAVAGVGEFRDDPSLSQVEIDMIVNWVEGGAPEGDPAYLPAAPHFSDAPKAPPVTGIVFARGAPRTITTSMNATGIRPRRLAVGESMEVTAIEPDGAVRRLIWIRHWRPEWQRTYYFREPVRLPRGTRIAVYSGAPAEAEILETGSR